MIKCTNVVRLRRRELLAVMPRCSSHSTYDSYNVHTLKFIRKKHAGNKWFISPTYQFCLSAPESYQLCMRACACVFVPVYLIDVGFSREIMT